MSAVAEAPARDDGSGPPLRGETALMRALQQRPRRRFALFAVEVSWSGEARSTPMEDLPHIASVLATRLRSSDLILQVGDSTLAVVAWEVDAVSVSGIARRVVAVIEDALAGVHVEVGCSTASTASPEVVWQRARRALARGRMRSFIRDVSTTDVPGRSPFPMGTAAVTTVRGGRPAPPRSGPPFWRGRGRYRPPA